MDKGTELTIHVEVPGDFLGPWMKNQCRNVAKNFINNVKFAENSFPNTVRSSFKGDELKVEAKNEISSFLSEAEIEKLIGKVSFKKKVDEIKKVIEKVGKKDKFLLDLLYESYLEWVPKIAKNYIDQGLSFEDLVKGGSLGLRSVVDKIEVKKRMNLEKQSYIAVWGINFYIVKRINLLRSTSDFEPSVHNEPESSTTNILKSDSKANELISETEALKKFAELKDQGIITEEEFNTKKKQILGL